MNLCSGIRVNLSSIQHVESEGIGAGDARQCEIVPPQIELRLLCLHEAEHARVKPGLRILTRGSAMIQKKSRPVTGCAQAMRICEAQKIEVGCRILTQALSHDPALVNFSCPIDVP